MTAKTSPGLSWPACVLAVVLGAGAHVLAWKYDGPTMTACLAIDAGTIATLAGAKALDLLGLQVVKK